MADREQEAVAASVIHGALEAIDSAAHADGQPLHFKVGSKLKSVTAVVTQAPAMSIQVGDTQFWVLVIKG